MYRKVNILGLAEAAYIAGIIDGEGTVTLTRKGKNQNRQLAITISNCERSILEHILSALGAGLISKKRIYSSKHSDAYAYRILNRQALSVLAQILPFLRSYKRNRAMLVLRDYVHLTPRNGKYSPQLRKKRERFVNNFFAILPHNVKTR